MYNYNTDSLGLILGVEVFFLVVTVQEHCGVISVSSVQATGERLEACLERRLVLLARQR